VVEAEVDPVEYLPRVKGIWLAINGGPILAESRARRNLTRLAIQALNWASREVVTYDEGLIPLREIRNYPLPLSEEIPPIKIDFQWGEGMSKGIGELPFATIPAAYAQAVSQALDYHFQQLPIGAASIWRMLKSRESEKAAP
jgi:CO/xanthine dehydrogenase Mo-binding subunit